MAKVQPIIQGQARGFIQISYTELAPRQCHFNLTCVN